MHDRPQLLDWAALAFLVVAWGSSFGLTKIAVQTVSPIWIVACRVSIGAIILIVVALARKIEWTWRPSDWAWMLWLGLCGNVFPFLLIGWGTKYIHSSVAGILMAVNPLIVLVLVWLFLPDEKLRPHHVVGFGLGFLGIIVLMGPHALGDLSYHGIQLAAEFALLGAATFYALLNVSARLAPNMGLVTKSVGVLICAVPISVTLAFWSDPSGLAHASAPAMIAIIIMAVFPTAIATLVLFWLVSRSGSRFVATSNYLVPVFATIIGVAFLSERLHPLHYTGLIVILAGIFVSEGRRRSMPA